MYKNHVLRYGSDRIGETATQNSLQISELFTFLLAFLLDLSAPWVSHSNNAKSICQPDCGCQIPIVLATCVLSLPFSLSRDPIVD